jgi:hypothetical protein
MMRTGTGGDAMANMFCSYFTALEHRWPAITNHQMGKGGRSDYGNPRTARRPRNALLPGDVEWVFSKEDVPWTGTELKEIGKR